MAKVSVVVPVYNAENYIEKCARSLFEQTLDDIEYIFVDDCSPDHSVEKLMKILDEYPNRSSQVSILHNVNNLGQAETRRKGILLAKGDYVIHCDPDDWVEIDMYERLYTAAIDSGAEIVMCDFFRNYPDGTQTIMGMADDVDKFMAFVNLYSSKRMGTLWGHLVARSIVQHQSIFWPQWNFTEDLTLVFQYFMKAKKLASVKMPLYHYRDNPNSISYQNHGDDYFRTHRLIKKWCKELNIWTDMLPYRLANKFNEKSKKLGETIGSDRDAQQAWLQTNSYLGFLELLKADLNYKQKLYASILLLHIMPFINKFVDIRHRIWSA